MACFFLIPLQPKGTRSPSSGKWDISRSFCFPGKEMEVMGDLLAFLFLEAWCVVAYWQLNTIFSPYALCVLQGLGAWKLLFSDFLPAEYQCTVLTWDLEIRREEEAISLALWQQWTDSWTLAEERFFQWFLAICFRITCFDVDQCNHDQLFPVDPVAS